MKRFALTLLLAAIAITSCSAKIILKGEIPLQDNGGDCVNPILGPNAAPDSSVQVRWAWYGRDIDSVLVKGFSPGDVVMFPRDINVRPGPYSIHVTIIDMGGESCVAVSTYVAKSPLAKFIFREP